MRPRQQPGKHTAGQSRRSYPGEVSVRHSPNFGSVPRETSDCPAGLQRHLGGSFSNSANVLITHNLPTVRDTLKLIVDSERICWLRFASPSVKRLTGFFINWRKANLRSFMTQGFNRIDFGGAARREVAG